MPQVPRARERMADMRCIRPEHPDI